MSIEIKKIPVLGSIGSIVIDAIGFVEAADSTAADFIPKLQELDQEFIRLADVFVNKIEFDDEIGLFDSTTSKCLGWQATLDAHGRNQAVFRATLDIVPGDSYTDPEFKVLISPVVCSCQKPNLNSQIDCSSGQDRDLDELELQIEKDLQEMDRLARSRCQSSPFVFNEDANQQTTVLDYSI